MNEHGYIRYTMLLSHVPDRDFTEDVVREHVAHLKVLDGEGKLVLCGPFKDHKGGMVIFRAGSYKEAEAIAEADPFVKQGFETYELRILELSCEENNHLGMG